MFISYNFFCVELLQLDTVVVEQVQFLAQYVYVNFGFTKKYVVNLAHMFMLWEDSNKI